MEPNAAPFGVHSKIDSIVLNAPVGDVYACCSRFEELPRCITSLQDVQKIDEGHLGAFDERGNKVRLGLSADHST
jgi:hypothetical protein